MLLLLWPCISLILSLRRPLTVAVLQQRFSALSPRDIMASYKLIGATALSLPKAQYVLRRIKRKLVSAAASQRTLILPLLSCGDSDSSASAALGHVAVSWGLSLMAVLLTSDRMPNSTCTKLHSIAGLQDTCGAAAASCNMLISCMTSQLDIKLSCHHLHDTSILYQLQRQCHQCKPQYESMPIQDARAATFSAGVSLTERCTIAQCRTTLDRLTRYLRYDNNMQISCRGLLFTRGSHDRQ